MSSGSYRFIEHLGGMNPFLHAMCSPNLPHALGLRCFREGVLEEESASDAPELELNRTDDDELSDLSSSCSGVTPSSLSSSPTLPTPMQQLKMQSTFDIKHIHSITKSRSTTTTTTIHTITATTANQSQLNEQTCQQPWYHTRNITKPRSTATTTTIHTITTTTANQSLLNEPPPQFTRSPQKFTLSPRQLQINHNF